MKMDNQSQEYLAEGHFYHQEEKIVIKPFWIRHLWKFIALIALAFAVIFASTTVILLGMLLPTFSPLVSNFTPTPGPTTNGSWQGQFTYYPGRPYHNPFQATLQIPPHQGDAFAGTLAEPYYGNSIVHVFGTKGGSSQFNQSQLQYVTQLYGNGTGTFISFTDPTYVQGNQIQLNCLYIAVIYSDESLHGVWFYYPDSSQPQPDGTFILNKIS